jgi:ectoine hydroxylase-related dioxygenase (phytanoyl-CoA dioxygenase family)
MKSPGFWIKENIFSEDECDEIAAKLSRESVNRSRVGMRNLMANRWMSDLANDQRLLRLVEDISEHPFIPYKATLFEKTGKANWLVAFHQDTALPIEKFIEQKGWGPVSVKNGVTFAHAPTNALRKILAIRIHLDPSTGKNGPLRVIPNSHHKRITSDDEFIRQVKVW